MRRPSLNPALSCYNNYANCPELCQIQPISVTSVGSWILVHNKVYGESEFGFIHIATLKISLQI